MKIKDFAITAIYSLVYRAGSEKEIPYVVEFVPIGEIEGLPRYVAISCCANNPETVYFANSDKSCYASNNRDYLELPSCMVKMLDKYICGSFAESGVYGYRPVGYPVKLTDAHKAMKIILRFAKSVR